MDNTDKLSSIYDMIIERGLISEPGMTFKYNDHLMEWDNATTPMLEPSQFNEELIDKLSLRCYICMIQMPLKLKVSKLYWILPKCCLTDLENITQECEELDKEEQ